jgi:hypothetical protein
MHPNTLSESVGAQTAEILHRRLAAAIDLRKLRNDSAGQSRGLQENYRDADDDQ